MSKAETRADLVAVLAAANEQDHERVRGRIADLTTELETLRAVEKILAIRLGKVEPKRPGPGRKAAVTTAAKPARPAEEPRIEPRPEGSIEARLQHEARRIDIARYLAHSGMARPGAILKDLAISPRVINDLLNHAWFARDGERIKLTPEGHQAVKSAAAD